MRRPSKGSSFFLCWVLVAMPAGSVIRVNLIQLVPLSNFRIGNQFSRPLSRLSRQLSVTLTPSGYS